MPVSLATCRQDRSRVIRSASRTAKKPARSKVCLAIRQRLSDRVGQRAVGLDIDQRPPDGRHQLVVDVPLRAKSCRVEPPAVVIVELAALADVADTSGLLEHQWQAAALTVELGDRRADVVAHWPASIRSAAPAGRSR